MYVLFKLVKWKWSGYNLSTGLNGKFPNYTTDTF